MARAGDLSRLGLQLEDDVFNDGQKRTDDGVDILAGKLASIRKAYIEQDLEIVVDVAAGEGLPDCQLIVRHIPARWHGHFHKVSASDAVDANLGNSALYVARDLVFVWTRDLAEGGEEVIPAGISSPTWIRLERFQQRKNLLGEIVERGTRQSSFEVLRVSNEREVELSDIDAWPEHPQAVAHGLVEAVPKIADGGGNDMAQAARDWPIEPDLVDFISSIRLDINDVGIGLTLKQPAVNGPKFVQAFVCLAD